MRILRGAEKDEFIEWRATELTNWIIDKKPATFSTRDLDIELRQAVIKKLNQALILTEFTGDKIRLQYLPED